MTRNRNRNRNRNRTQRSGKARLRKFIGEIGQSRRNFNETIPKFITQLQTHQNENEMKRNSRRDQSEIRKINEIDKRVIYVWISFYSVINAQLPRPVKEPPLPIPTMVFCIWVVLSPVATWHALPPFAESRENLVKASRGCCCLFLFPTP